MDPLIDLVLPEPPPISDIEINSGQEECALAAKDIEVESCLEEILLPLAHENVSISFPSKSESGEKEESSTGKNEKIGDDVDTTFEHTNLVLPPLILASSSTSTLEMESSITTPLSGASALDSKANSCKQYSKGRKDVEDEDEREKMQLLVSNFSDQQYDRYEMFRRSTFPKAAIKRLMQTITGNAVSQNVVIAMSGIAKVFVGEVVEEALDAVERVGDTGPLRPKHLREAVRRLRSRNRSCSIPRSNTRRYNPFPL